MIHYMDYYEAKNAHKKYADYDLLRMELIYQLKVHSTFEKLLELKIYKRSEFNKFTSELTDWILKDPNNYDIKFLHKAVKMSANNFVNGLKKEALDKSERVIDTDIDSLKDYITQQLDELEVEYELIGFKLGQEDHRIVLKDRIAWIIVDDLDSSHILDYTKIYCIHTFRIINGMIQLINKNGDYFADLKMSSFMKFSVRLHAKE